MKRTILILQLLMVVLVVPAQAQQQKKQGRDFRKEFDKFKKDARKEYNDFRKKATAEYAKFVREAWEEFGAEPPIPIPEDEKVEPQIAPGFEEETASWFSKLFGGGDDGDKANKKAEKQRKKEEKRKMREKSNVALQVEQVFTSKPAEKQPQPLAQVQQAAQSNPYMNFEVFGTECKVRVGDNCRFKLKGVTPDDVADAIEMFLKPQYDNMLYDCLQERQKNNFSDWAYYQMLLALTNKFYGKGSNEATMALGFLYSQSGYKMRFATDKVKLYMLVSSSYTMIGKPYFYVDGEWYYQLGDGKESLQICRAKFPKEASMSLQIVQQQSFANKPVLERTITSVKNPDFSFTVRSNKNSIDFYDTYPCAYSDNNIMTRWANYANTPLDQNITSQLYPAMREKMNGMTPLEKVQQLDWWCQGMLDLDRKQKDAKCFLYAYDETVWGYDRNFFGEESLFYPYYDCEDRAILLSHLVRDLVGLDVVLVLYPGHLAMAVHFKENVEGNYLLINGRKFVVVDPTYVGSDVGEPMPQFKNAKVSTILLKRG